jgi:hypothetical protein
METDLEDWPKFLLRARLSRVLAFLTTLKFDM